LDGATAAFAWLTILGLIEKGRMIEIEAIYVSLFAFALILWLIWWQQRRSSWLTFTVPWIFLGLGLLAKGPTHLLFFYVLIFVVLWRSGHLRDLLHPAHLVGLILMSSIFAAWAIPYFREVHWHSPLQVWSHEAAAAFQGEEGRMENWSLNFPRGLAYFLPWLLLVPFIRPRKIAEPLTREVLRGLISGTVLLLVIVLLIPGTLPRYVLPLAAPFCWIIGVAVDNNAFDWNLGLGKFRLRVPAPLVIALIAAGVLAAMVIFPLRSATFLKKHEYLKGIAAQINGLVPAGDRLYAINPPYQPYLFYVRPMVIYLRSLNELPRNAHYLLAPPSYEHQIETSLRWAASGPRLIARTPRANSSQTVLFALEEHRDSPAIP
jgi:4-amino-4-deoxy-L-arabinose transferase-like glycosyltransferase